MYFCWPGCTCPACLASLRAFLASEGSVVGTGSVQDSFGGESGSVVRTLIEREGIAVHGIEADAGNVAYVHDRRSGEREVVAEMDPEPLSRHDVDELYGKIF